MNDRPAVRRANSRPIGQPTRGKTALNRLRQIDVYLALRWQSLIAGGSPLVIDVGYGAQAWTAIELWDRLRVINPRLRLIGLEIDPARVAIAQPFAQRPALDFALGGFNVADVLDASFNRDRATIIRAYNVLRQYDESAVIGALRQMSEGLIPGGLLIEGTSTPSGGHVVFDVYERRSISDVFPLRHRAIVFGTNFRTSVEAADFQPILPKRLIHRMREPTVAAFFAAWQHEWLIRRQAGAPAPRRQTWIATALALADRYPISRSPGLIRRGYLELRDPMLPIG